MWPGTIVLRCPPCSWGKCVFCGFSRECLISPQPSSDEFLKQLDCYFDKYGVGGHTEIYNSGSFLDDKQVSHDSRVNIFGKLENSGVGSAVKGYEMWKSGKWVPLKKSFFREIIKLAEEIVPDIDYSSKGLARL